MENAVQKPAKTTQILDAISKGCKTIGAISERTGIDKRAVNAFIYSLEKQGRVRALSYNVVRADQYFHIINADADLKRGRDRVHPYKTVERDLPPRELAKRVNRKGKSASCKNDQEPEDDPSMAPQALQRIFYSLVSPSVGRQAYAHA